MAGLLVVALVLGAACSSGDGAGDGAATTSTAPSTAPAGPGTGGVVVTPDVVPVPPGGTATVRVDWVGQQPRTLMFVSICRRSTTVADFQPGIDCSALSEVNPNGTPDGSGSVELTVFRGPTPDGDSPWGCFAPGDQAPPGIQAVTTCYVRVTNDVVLNQQDARDAPFTLTDP